MFFNGRYVLQKITPLHSVGILLGAMVGAFLGANMSQIPVARADDEIQVVRSIVQYLRGIKKGDKALVVLDLDNTTLQQYFGNDVEWSSLGRDEWLFYLEEYFAWKREQAGETPEHAKAHALKDAEAVWNEIQALVRVRPVEPELVAEIARLQSLGIPVIGLTARIQAIADLTDQQLASVGIDLRKNAFAVTDPVIHSSVLGTADSAIFQNGVIYIGETNVKGDILLEFLKNRFQFANGPIEEVFFFDDKLKHAKSVTASMKALGLRVNAFRFDLSDSHTQPFIKRSSEAMLALKAGDVAQFERVMSEGELFPDPNPQRSADLREAFLRGRISADLAYEIAHIRVGLLCKELSAKRK